jgi:hypothetical protein
MSKKMEDWEDAPGEVEREVAATLRSSVVPTGCEDVLLKAFSDAQPNFSHALRATRSDVERQAPELSSVFSLAMQIRAPRARGWMSNISIVYF